MARPRRKFAAAATANDTGLPITMPVGNSGIGTSFFAPDLRQLAYGRIESEFRTLQVLGESTTSIMGHVREMNTGSWAPTVTGQTPRRGRKPGRQPSATPTQS